MKFSIEQHREQLKSMEAVLAWKQDEIRAREKDAARLALECDRLRLQIDEAERQRKDGFDCDKFLKSK